MGYRHLAALSLVLSTNLAVAAETPVCRYCPDPGSSIGAVRFGIGFIDQNEPSPMFYNPWRENSNPLLLWASLTERDASNGYFETDIRMEGEDSAAIHAIGGRQGRYSLSIDYDRLTVLRAPGAKTPFTLVGDHLSLPAGWTTAATTSNMVDLAGSVQPAELGATHENVAVGLSIDSGRWRYSSRLSQRETQSRRAIGGMIGASYTSSQTAILAVPQTHYTQDFTVSAELVGNNATVLSFGYLGSRFSNTRSSISWDNPFDPATTAATGAFGLAPDNLFHQFYIQGRQRLTDSAHASFRLAYSRYLQDDQFVPASTSTTIVLPRPSAEAQIDAWVGDVRYNQQVTDKLGLEARYGYEDQDNQTPRATYLYPVGDTAAPTYEAANEPYSFRKQRLALSADYRLTPTQRVHAGASGNMQDRTYLEVEHSKEGNLWLEYRWQPRTAPELAFRVEGQQRRVDDYQPNPIENPLMRKFNMADRDAQRYSLRSHYQAESGWDIGLQLGFATHTYTDTWLGLHDTIEHNAQLDLGYPVTSRLTLSGYVGWQGAETQQRSHDVVSGLDWDAKLRDFNLSGGMQIQWRSESERWEHTLGLYGLFYRGEYTVAETNYPDITGTSHQLSLVSRYRYADDVDLELQFVQQRFIEEDWAREYIAPNSLDYVLGLGEGVADYSLWVTYLTVRQRF